MFLVSLKNYTNPVVAGGRVFYGWVPCQTGNQRRTKFVELSKYDQIGSLHPAGPRVAWLRSGTLNTVGSELVKMKISRFFPIKKI